MGLVTFSKRLAVYYESFLTQERLLESYCNWTLVGLLMSGSISAC